MLAKLDHKNIIRYHSCKTTSHSIMCMMVCMMVYDGMCGVCVMMVYGDVGVWWCVCGDGIYGGV